MRRSADHRDTDAEIFGFQGGGKGRSVLGAAGNEDRIDLACDGEVALDTPQRREDGANVGLLGPQRKFAEPVPREHAREHEPHRPSDVLLASEQRFDRNLGGFLEPGQQHVTVSGADFGRKSRRDIDTVSGWQLVELPESLVHTVDEDVRGAAARRFERHEAVGHDDRRRVGRAQPLAKILRELLAEEPDRAQDEVRPSQPAKRDVAETAAHRVADDQRAGEHRDRCGHAKQDGEVRAPVVSGAPRDERPERHACRL